MSFATGQAASIRDLLEEGVIELNGVPDLMNVMDELLESLVEQGGVKLPSDIYTPYYRIADFV